VSTQHHKATRHPNKLVSCRLTSSESGMMITSFMDVVQPAEAMNHLHTAVVAHRGPRYSGSRQGPEVLGTAAVEADAHMTIWQPCKLEAILDEWRILRSLVSHAWSSEGFAAT
jgi:hypothetical protein